MKYHRILLTQPPTNHEGVKESYPQPPLGLANIAAVLEDKIDVMPILDGNVSDNYFNDLENLIKSENPDVVGFTAYTSFMKKVFEAASLIKNINPEILVIVGGPHATVLPELTLNRCHQIDIAVIGEGELTIQEIVEGKPLAEIMGIVYRNGENIIKNKSRPIIKDLDSLPFPAYHKLPNFPQSYSQHPPKSSGKLWTSVMWSRGCPFKCSYCSRDASFGRIYRCNSPVYVVNLLKYLHFKFGIEEITFYDDVFTLNRYKTMNLLEQLYPEKLGFKLIWDCETRVDLVDPDLLKAMKCAGCQTVAYGVEHGLWINEIKGGRATVEQAEKAIRWTHKAKLQTIGYFMIGLPNETTETIKTTIELAKKLDVTWAQFAITTPIPGSELYKQIVAINSALDDNWDNMVYESSFDLKIPLILSKNLSESDLIYWKHKAYRDFYFRPSYILKRFFSINNIQELKMHINGLKILLSRVNF